MRKSCVLRIDKDIPPVELIAPYCFTVVCTPCPKIRFTQSLFPLTKILFIEHVILRYSVCSLLYVSMPDQLRI